MTNDRIAINKRLALRMFFDAGYDTEQGLSFAAKLLAQLEEPTAGYYYADAVVESIEYNLADA